MKITLSDNRNRLAALLPTLEHQPFSYTDPTRFPECRTERLVPTRLPIVDLRVCNWDFLFAYDIFPPSILRFVAAWQVQRREMQPDDVIVQQVYLPPTPVSLKCIFAVRVLEVVCDANRVGFRYGTLQGHAETGVSDFAFVLRDQKLYAQIHTFSRPGHVLSRAVASVLTLPYQRYCTKRALERMQAGFERSNLK